MIVLLVNVIATAKLWIMIVLLVNVMLTNGALDAEGSHHSSTDFYWLTLTSMARGGGAHFREGKIYEKWLSSWGPLM